MHLRTLSYEGRRNGLAHCARLCHHLNSTTLSASATCSAVLAQARLSRHATPPALLLTYCWCGAMYVLALQTRASCHPAAPLQVCSGVRLLLPCSLLLQHGCGRLAWQMHQHLLHSSPLQLDGSLPDMTPTRHHLFVASMCSRSCIPIGMCQHAARPAPAACRSGCTHQPLAKFGTQTAFARRGASQCATEADAWCNPDHQTACTRTRAT